MSEGRARDVLQRFERFGRRDGPRLYLTSGPLRRLVAASTEAQLVVGRVHVHAPGGSSLLEPVDLADTTSWAAAVFRANAAALAAVERVTADRPTAECALELVGRVGYWSGRSLLPASACADDELRWRLESLDASLATAAAAGIPVDDGAKATIAELQAELARRKREAR